MDRDNLTPRHGILRRDLIPRYFIHGKWQLEQSGTWSHVSHTGPAATTMPGTGTDVIIGNGNTVTFTGNTNVVANTATGTWIMSGATLNAVSFDFNVWGTLRIDGQLLNGGILTGDFDLYATGEIPVFDEIRYGVSGFRVPYAIYTLMLLHSTEYNLLMVEQYLPMVFRFACRLRRRQLFHFFLT